MEEFSKKITSKIVQKHGLKKRTNDQEMVEHQAPKTVKVGREFVESLNKNRAHYENVGHNNTN